MSDKTDKAVVSSDDDRVPRYSSDQKVAIEMMEEISTLSLEVPLDGQRIFNRKVLEALKAIFKPELKVDTSNVLEKIAQNTVYVPFSELMKALTAHFVLFQEKIGDQPFYLYLPPVLKSTLLLAGHFWPKIKTMNFQGFFYDHSKIRDGMTVLILDDCVYSGCSLLSIIDCASYKHKYSGTFRVVLGYCSKSFLHSLPYQMRSFNQRILIHCSRNNLISHIQWSEKELPYLEKVLNCEAYGPLPVYFDHKISGSCSSYPSVYNYPYSKSSVCMTTHPPYDIKTIIRQNRSVQKYLLTSE